MVTSGKSGLNYAGAGVNVAHADETKKELKAVLDCNKPAHVLNSVGAFASLIDISSIKYAEPVLVMKTEEPGTKQKLAFESDGVESLCYDLVNHLINDIAVMGAKPLAVQDCIVCGALDGKIVKRLVKGMAEACHKQGASLVGGETSEQPGVVPAGLYILSASVIGIIEKSRIIDGSKVQAGDAVFAVQSCGVHTNGYTLIRKLLERDASLADKRLASFKDNDPAKTFFEAIMVPHRCYAQPLLELAESSSLSSMAHITGGGIAGNLNRVMPPSMQAKIELSELQILPVFKAIRDAGQVTDSDMLAAFNMGAGLVGTCRPEKLPAITEVFAKHGDTAYPIGIVQTMDEPHSHPVTFTGSLVW